MPTLSTLAGALLLLLGIAPAFAADANWSGAWMTKWPGGSSRIELRQDGATVEGSVKLYNRRIAGKVVGDKLEGEWTEGAAGGRFVFVLGATRDDFVGRFDDGDWWTGARTSARELLPESRDASPRQALRSFVLAGNVAVAGYTDAYANLAPLVDFGADAAAFDQNARLVRARTLFDAVSRTTFQLASLGDPRPGERSITYTLRQAGTDATLALTLRDVGGNRWRIVAPSEEALAAADRALLKRDGRPSPPDSILALRSPRDTMRAFVDSMRHWESAGRARALGTMDLSQIRPASRDTEGWLQAQYLVEVINRVGAWDWQEIPDDPASREPYVFFSHPAGRIAIAPMDGEGGAKWRFTADTVSSGRALYVATGAMPPAWGMPVVVKETGVFALRHSLLDLSPWFLERSAVSDFENWQIVALCIMLTFAALFSWLGVLLLVRLVGAGLRLLGRPVDARLERRLVWPLRLIAFALIWYRFRQRAGLVGPGVEVLDSAAAIVLAIGVVWAGLPLVDALAAALYGRGTRAANSMDDIVVSLTAGLLKLAMIVTMIIVAAQAVDLPVTGLVASLGIGGLAVAFASKEALSNVFGAGILMADRPFRNGDTISIDNVVGTVEHVGIRSTRIRTADDTVVVLPNGKLSDAMINNYGARRLRLFRTTLKVEKGATPEQLEAFTHRLRKMVDGNPVTSGGRTQVGLWQLAPDGIEVNLVCYLNVANESDEGAARHRLLLDVMRLASETGVKVA